MPRNFDADVGVMEIKKHSVTAMGESVKAWTCEKNGVLLLVTQFPEGEFESRAIAMSGQFMIDFGEVTEGVLNRYEEGKSAPLTQEGLAQTLKSGLVTLSKKIVN